MDGGFPLSSLLPSDSALDRAVQTFGIGTYDDDAQENLTRGEDSADNEKSQKENTHGSLPTDGDSDFPTPDLLVSYPITSSAELPGDVDAPARGRKSWEGTLLDSVPTEPMGDFQSKIPVGQEPSARTDYYDNMSISQVSEEDLWPSGDGGEYGVYAQSIPTPEDNEVSVDNELQSLGNYWSGFVVEDVSDPKGFPSDEFLENSSYPKGDVETPGKVLAMKIATNHKLVSELSEQFKKSRGSDFKYSTRRDILHFLNEEKQPLYLASDIIRLMKLRHDIHVKDVLDEFPVHTVSVDFRNDVKNIQNVLLASSVLKHHSRASETLRKLASSLSRVNIDLETYERIHG